MPVRPEVGLTQSHSVQAEILGGTYSCAGTVGHSTRGFDVVTSMHRGGGQFRRFMRSSDRRSDNDTNPTKPAP